MGQPRFEFASFNAGEAATISGVSGDQQRNLRRHGYMAPIDGGKARFSLEDIARLVAIGFLSERGIPPATSATIADACAAMIVAHALEQDDAVDKDARKALIEKLEPRGVARFAVATGPNSRTIKFGNDLRKIYFAAAELGGAIVCDLKVYGLKIVTGAKRPLVTLLADEKDVA